MKLWLLFDFDGTIADSIEELFNLINGMAPRFGYQPITRERFETLRDLPLNKACSELQVPFYKLGTAIPVLLKELHQFIPRLRTYPGINEMLDKLREIGVNLALISSNSKENLDAFLKHNSLNHFSWVEGTGGVLFKHAQIARLIKKHALSSAKVIYVGDEVRDITAARKCGIQVISVNWGLHSAKHLAVNTPDYQVDTPDQVSEIVLDILKTSSFVDTNQI